jgi:Lrp/AsnC family leucine-responsive transcriptional regulator
MDSMDRKILAALQADGRMTNQALADAVGLSPSPCLRRVRALEDQGLIAGYAAVLDREAAGLPITAFVRVKLTEHTSKTVSAFERAVAAMEEVLQFHLTSGAEDYLLEVVVDSHRGYERFLRERLNHVPGVAAIETSFSLGAIKRTTALPVASR